MAKKDEHLPLQSEIDSILYCPKFVDFTGLKWGLKPPPGRSPVWFQISINPTDISGIPISGLVFTLQWRPAAETNFDGFGDCPKMNLVALYYGKRIFAVDTYPHDRHTNRTIVKHPDFVNSILGPHYHLYFEEAGVCEIGLEIKEKIKPDDFLGYWNFFCSKLNIIVNGDIPLPTEDDSGQMQLL